MTPDPTERAFYFGTYLRVGHYLWDAETWRSSLAWPPGNHPLPWNKLDGTLDPATDIEGAARLTHKDGWTALAFANFTDDRRPRSNSAFFFEGTLTFDEAVAAARARFPHVVERFAFEIREASDDG